MKKSYSHSSLLGFNTTTATDFDEIIQHTVWTNAKLFINKNKYSENNYSEVVAHAKIMAVIASSMQTEDRMHDVSVVFASGLVSEDEWHKNYFSTASSVANRDKSDFPESAKERLHLQLSEHEMMPRIYRLKDGARAIEFDHHFSRLVCIFDEDGLQLMWKGSKGVESEVIVNENINFYKVLQKIAVVLAAPSHAKATAIEEACAV